MNIIKDLRELTGLKIKAMSDDELFRTLQTAAMHVHGRMKQIENAGLENYSKAYDIILRKYKDSSGKFKGIGPAGKTRFEMERALKDASIYLDSQTGTVTGTRTWMKNVVNAARGLGAYGDNRSDLLDAEIVFRSTVLSDEPDFWEFFHKVEEEYGGLESNTLIQAVYDTWTMSNNKDIDDMLNGNDLKENIRKAEEKELGLSTQSVEEMTAPYFD